MIHKILASAKTIAVGGHIRPDGDCVGSCLGFSDYIEENYPGIKVDVYLEEIPEWLYYLKGVEKVLHEIPEGKVYDAFVCLDCADEERLGFSAPLFRSAKHTFCIDHHASNHSFAEENYIVPDASSTAELMYRFLDDEKISRSVAEDLYLGIAHDTGVFQYSCTSPDTHRIAANLLEKGIDAEKLIQETFYEKTYAQNQVLGRALMESFLLQDGKCIASYIRLKEMEFYGITSADLEGVVSQLRNTQGVETAIFMYEISPNQYKVSLRSTHDVDVSVIAQYFGGGGHKKAAGFTMSGTPYDVINNISRQIAEQMEEKGATR